MKKNDNITNKVISQSSFIASICFYAVSVICFINNESSTGVIFLGVGSVFLCLGSTYLNKEKESNKKDKK